VDIGSQRFIEYAAVPPDAERVDTTWRFANMDGGPDLRFNNNRELPVMLYGELTLGTPNGLRWLLHVSNLAVAKRLATDLAMLRHVRGPEFMASARADDSVAEFARSIVRLEHGFWETSLGPFVRVLAAMRRSPAGATHELDQDSLRRASVVIDTEVLPSIYSLTRRTADSADRFDTQRWDQCAKACEAFVRTARAVRDEIARLLELDPAGAEDLGQSVAAITMSYKDLIARLKDLDPTFVSVGEMSL
jgi:hypothetical protein